MIKIDNVRDFNTDHIFDCGQCFRWEREDDGSYTGIAGSMTANVSYDNETVTIEGMGDEAFWRDYLDLDRDYSAIKEVLSSGDETITKAIDYGSGIRLLNQNRWETIISFIISQNNNIPRIKGCINTLSENFGEKAGSFRGKEYYCLPSPEVLGKLDAQELSSVRLGYRAPYLVKTGKQVYEDGGEEYLDELVRKKSQQEIYEYLTGLHGIGPKVANCIMLFAMKQYDSFPVDVWVKRVMNTLYGFEESDVKGMKAFAAERFGEYGGFAQQYLFYYIRSLGNSIDKK